LPLRCSFRLENCTFAQQSAGPFASETIDPGLVVSNVKKSIEILHPGDCGSRS
jgi:hypothetical protein